MTTDNLFSDFVSEFSEGWLDREATERLADLIKAVKITGQKGTLTLQLDVVPRAVKDGDIVVIRPTVKDRTPKITIDPEVFRTYDDGDLELLPKNGGGDGLDDDKPSDSNVTQMRKKRR